MKTKLFLTVLTFAFAVSAFATSPIMPGTSVWKTAPIKNVQILETFPVQYAITFKKLCNDIVVEPIKFVSNQEVVLGVAVKNHPQLPCLMHAPLYTLERITIAGDEDDPQTVKTLK